MEIAKNIVGLINTNLADILDYIDKESIVVYDFLRSRYKQISEEPKKNTANDYLFKFVYRTYYRLDNAGLTDDLKNKYFELLDSKTIDLEILLNKLYDIKSLRGYNTVQFSFATKLLHTINNDLPVYDSYVAHIIDIKPSGTGKVQKISSCLKCYADLKDLYANLRVNDEMKALISKFKETFPEIADISDVKCIDFMLWAYGKLIKIK